VSEETAFVGFPVHLDCGRLSGMIVDWTHQISENVGRPIVVNGTIQGNDSRRFSVDESGIVIRDIKASDAGVYVCGHNASIYHKINLTVSCECLNVIFEIVLFVNSNLSVLVCLSRVAVI